jgi:hypothetical protein
MKSNSGNWVREDVLGVPCELLNGTFIRRRDALRVVQDVVGVGFRQARGALSSYWSEGWTEPRGRLNDGFARADLFTQRVKQHAASRLLSSVANGRRGGRRK